MADISFYHLTRSRPETALFQLLEKAYEGGHRCLVRVSEEALVDQLDTALWVLKPDSFLPHETNRGDNPKDAPILLTDKAENLNKAEFAFILPGASAEGLDYFERVFLLFEGNRESELNAARKLWKDFAETGMKPTYWTQGEQGRWSKKEV